MQNTPSLDIEILSNTPQDFEDIFQRGFFVSFTTGCTLREFLCEQVGVCGDYAQIRIQTIFLNGQPVDDVDTTYLNDTDALAFSAAMPGLVGATMRRGGYYASLRESISHHGDEHTIEIKQSRIRVRLFNFLARELAGTFLRYGIYIQPDEFITFLNRQSNSFFDRTKFRKDTMITTREQLVETVDSFPGSVKLTIVEQ